VSSPATGALRSLRAALLGAVCVALALAGHVAAGGRAPSAWALLILAVPMGVVALALTSRRRGLPVIGATVAVSQVCLHQALMWSAAANCSVSGDLHAHLGHAGSGAVVRCAPMAGMTGIDGIGSMASRTPARFSTAAMALAHVVAGLVTTLVLAHGEALLWRLWHRLTRLPAPRAVRLSPVVARVLFPAYDVLPARLTGGPTRRRGPPLAAPVTV
jgi:hypothetical protein